MAGDEATSGVRRRTVLKGAAWSVPVAAVAIAVPARAASPTCEACDDNYAITQTLEKEEGAWQYKDTIAITHCGDPVSVQGAVVLVKFDDPDEVKTTTDAHNCSPSYDPATATLTVTGNADTTSMDFAVSFNTQGASDRDITGNVTVFVPGCTDPVVVAQPFVFHAIKQ